MNPRGYVWMTLQILLKMSPIDIHFFFLQILQNFPKEIIVHLILQQSPMIGEEAKKQKIWKRLNNALRDAKLNNKRVNKFLIWLDDAIQFFHHTNESGALMVCKLIKNKLPN